VVDGDARAGDRHSSSRSQSSVDREDPSAILEMVACGESARLPFSDRAEKALAGLDGPSASATARAGCASGSRPRARGRGRARRGASSACSRLDRPREPVAFTRRSLCRGPRAKHLSVLPTAQNGPANGKATDPASTIHSFRPPPARATREAAAERSGPRTSRTCRSAPGSSSGARSERSRAAP
jgi:hypothetical protein